MLESYSNKALREKSDLYEKNEEAATLKRHQQRLRELEEMERREKYESNAAYRAYLALQVESKTQEKFQDETKMNDRERKYHNA